MNLLPGTQRITGDSAIGTSGHPIRVFSVELISGGTASTLILKNGTSGSADAYAQVDGTANKGALLNYAGGKLFPAGCYADADANISYSTIVYTEEL